MVGWEYQITVHQLPENLVQREGTTFECDQDGLCFIHDAYPNGIQWVEELFRQKGEQGWELVQSGYHHRELLCIWKKRKEAEKA
ncbi:MAG: hypothetical protein ACE144_05505 [Thermodesulfobacteriota bacterium]